MDYENFDFENAHRLTNEVCYYCNGDIKSFPMITMSRHPDQYTVQWFHFHVRCYDKARSEKSDCQAEVVGRRPKGKAKAGSYEYGGN